jgi:anti-sigma factor RsiW
MSPTTCPDVEALFIGLEEGRPEALQHLRQCPACAAIQEEHRQLEKDLFRVSDPLPPPDFVQQVMAKVEKAPVPVRREVWTGMAILVAALAAAAVLVLDSGAAGLFGTELAQALLSARSLLVAVPDALRAVWQTAGVLVTAAASVLLVFVLFGLRRLAGGPVEVRVSA